MRHILFTESETYSIAVLIKGTSFNKRELQLNYINPLVNRGIAEDSLIAFDLQYNEDGKAPVKFIKEYLDELLPVLESLAVKSLYVPDSNYFKVLTGQTKAEPHFGYVLSCKIKGYEHMNVVLGINYQALIYNPDLQAKLNMSLDTLSAQVAGTYQALGSGIIHSAWYPEGTQEIREALQSLHQYPSLSADIEGFSLRFNEAGIGTIAFAWDEHNGIAFACDYRQVVREDGSMDSKSPQESWASHAGYNCHNDQVRALLLEFFSAYKGEITWHNSPYDVKAIIYALWMDSLMDRKGMLTGLDTMTRNMHDTKVIAYLATNSTAGNSLGLKSLAHEFAGNWAVEEIKDIRKVPLPKLLQYNLVDAMSTQYVKKKYWPIMVQDNQLELYQSLMMPSQKLIMQMELVGMPLSKTKVQEVKGKLEAIQATHLEVIQNSPVIKLMNLLLTEAEWEDDYQSRKAKAKNPSKILPKDRSTYPEKMFNPNSGPQLQRLLYEQMGLPILDRTETKQPATGADTIEKLINHTQEPAYKAILEALIGYGKVSKILSTFIPAFEQALEKGTGDTVWLHGNFNLGGTVSGRLSSSDPNLQNIPANSTYGKLIKECFVAESGWLFGGADFNSLEDMISALTTKDKNKIKVYTDGYCGHCLRAFTYFKDEMPDIVDTVDSINSIKKKYPDLRQDSKPGTFLLTYGGTYHGMMKNLGWSEEKSKAIEASYHELYAESDEFIQTRLKQASKDGYVDVAFGLRVRTPLLKQVMFGSSKMPYEAAAEGRTAGNAMGQSYGLLNNRAAVEFMQKVWASKHRFDIFPVGLIHDSIYLLVKDNVEVVEWANRELIKSMQWQELPEIQHPTVKLGANLDVFWPSWKNAITLPNNADQATITKTCKEGKQAWLDKQSKGKKHEETPQPANYA